MGPSPSSVRQASPVIPLWLEDDVQPDGEASSIPCPENICASDVNECTDSPLQRLAAQRHPRGPRGKLPRSMSAGACLSLLADGGDLNGSVEFLGDPRLLRCASKGVFGGLETLREGVDEAVARSRTASGLLDTAGQLHVPVTPSSYELPFES